MGKRRQSRSRYASASRPTSTTPDRVITSIRVPVTLYDECCLIALRGERSVHATMIDALQRYARVMTPRHTLPR